MSDIANISITSEISAPMHCSTLRQNIEKEDVVLRTQSDIENEAPKSETIMNNLKTNTDNDAETYLIKMNNNNTVLKTKIHNGCAENADPRDQKKNTLTKLKVVITSPQRDDSNVIHVVNDISKGHVTGKESTPIRPLKQNRPIMGRTALLKKANIDTNDSLIVHDLINEKYNGALDHYINRMSQRRLSRLASSEEYYSDTVFSSPPNGSPLSVSSINTPNSMPPDERTGFQFPTNLRSTDYKFLVSTDDTNIETTTDGPDESSINSINNTNDKSTTSVSEYDPKKFLENAIGDVTNLSHISVSNGKVVFEDNKHHQPDDCSVGTSELSALISRASTFYNSLKRNIKKGCSFKVVPSINWGAKKENESSVVSHNTVIEDLMRQLSIQNEILFQVSKALEYCKKTKEFQASTELIEAEKILLIATRTKEAITEEIYNADDNTDQCSNKHPSSGKVEISTLKFLLKNRTCTHHRDFTEHFLVLLNCGIKVQASDVVTADTNGTVHIKKCFKFTELPTDFEIGLSVYSMKVSNKAHHSHEYRSLSPKNLFHLHRNSKKGRLSNDIFIRPSSFSLRGKYEIRCSELSKVEQTGGEPSPLTLNMHHTSLNSPLSRLFSINIRGEVTLINKMNGFLTIGMNNEHGCTIWNRRWCVLHGAIFRYWNYPSEEVANPLGSVDLSYCLDQEVLTADRSLCARPRTLMLTVQCNRILKKYLLSADNCEDFKQWQKELTYVISSLRVWNGLNTAE